MRILSIETSCDETGVAIISFEKKGSETTYIIESEQLHSQIDIHQEYGGVYPTIAKREHQRILPILLQRALKEAGSLEKTNKIIFTKEIKEIAKKHECLAEELEKLFENTAIKNIDALAVTQGPGLAPALWVGVTTARILSIIWDIPVIPVNHMEGHIIASFANNGTLHHQEGVTLSLLVSGGHTELVLTTKDKEYKRIGHTLDDAAGEAFDKTARLLGLSYPGGPEISKLAEKGRKDNIKSPITLPRPMINDKTYNFSYSGLKTAVRTFVEKQDKLTEKIKIGLAKEFENAVIDTLLAKTIQAIEEYGPKNLIIGGGVSANLHLRSSFTEALSKYQNTKLYLPASKLSTDNAIMIGLAAYTHKDNFIDPNKLTADSNLHFPNIIK